MQKNAKNNISVFPDAPPPIDHHLALVLHPPHQDSYLSINSLSSELNKILGEDEVTLDAFPNWIFGV